MIRSNYLTDGLIVMISALTGRSARRRLARIPFNQWGWFCRSQAALNKRITNVVLFTLAYWRVASHCASSMNSTSSDAGINTFVISARFVRWAVGIENALRFTANVRIAKIFWITFTITGFSLTFAMRVGATHWTRVSRLRWWPFDDSGASSERIAFIAGAAMTNWRVVDYPTFCVVAARPSAWISTFVLNAGMHAGTLIMRNALWSAVWRWAYVTRSACASWSGSRCPAICVWSARRWHARILRNLRWRTSFWRRWRYSCASDEWITLKPGRARANCTVADGPALRALTTGGTWIHTFLISTSLAKRTVAVHCTFWPAEWRASDISWDTLCNAIN